MAESRADVNSDKWMVACRNNPKIKDGFVRRKRPHDRSRRHDFKKSTYYKPKTILLSNEREKSTTSLKN